jgi:hypothetical protein
LIFNLSIFIIQIQTEKIMRIAQKRLDLLKEYNNT